MQNRASVPTTAVDRASRLRTFSATVASRVAFALALTSFVVVCGNAQTNSAPSTTTKPPSIVAPNTTSSGEAQVRPFRPDVSIVVQKHATGADMVQISLLSPNYRAEAFAQRINKLGTLLGSAPRGLTVFAEDLSSAEPTQVGTKNKATTQKLVFLKATFAIDGIINGSAGIKLEPLVKAFAGGQGAEEVKALEVVLTGGLGGPGTVRRFVSDSVEVQGQSVLKPPMLDYRIWLLTNDPEAVHIPDRADALPPNPPVASPKTGINPFLLWGTIVLMAGAAAVLVYNLTLRRRSSGPGRTSSRSNSVHRVP